MTELTHLDAELDEVLGLAQAAQTATNKVATLVHWKILAKLNKTADDADTDKNTSHGTAYVSSMRSRYAGTPCCGISPAGGRCRGVEL